MTELPDKVIVPVCKSVTMTDEIWQQMSDQAAKRLGADVVLDRYIDGVTAYIAGVGADTLNHFDLYVFEVYRPTDNPAPGSPGATNTKKENDR